MRTIVKVPGLLYKLFYRFTETDDREIAAILFGNVLRWGENLLVDVMSFYLPPQTRTGGYVLYDQPFSNLLRISKKLDQLLLGTIHTHPFNLPNLSGGDEGNKRVMAPYIVKSFSIKGKREFVGKFGRYGVGNPAVLSFEFDEELRKKLLDLRGKKSFEIRTFKVGDKREVYGWRAGDYVVGLMFQDGSPEGLESVLSNSKIRMELPPEVFSLWLLFYKGDKPKLRFFLDKIEDDISPKIEEVIPDEKVIIVDGMGGELEIDQNTPLLITDEGVFADDKKLIQMEVPKYSLLILPWVSFDGIVYGSVFDNEIVLGFGFDPLGLVYNGKSKGELKDVLKKVGWFDRGRKVLILERERSVDEVVLFPKVYILSKENFGKILPKVKFVADLSEILEKIRLPREYLYSYDKLAKTSEIMELNVSEEDIVNLMKDQLHVRTYNKLRRGDPLKGLEKIVGRFYDRIITVYSVLRDLFNKSFESMKSLYLEIGKVLGNRGVKFSYSTFLKYIRILEEVGVLKSKRIGKRKVIEEILDLSEEDFLERVAKYKAFLKIVDSNKLIDALEKIANDSGMYLPRTFFKIFKILSLLHPLIGESQVGLAFFHNGKSYLVTNLLVIPHISESARSNSFLLNGIEYGPGKYPFYVMGTFHTHPYGMPFFSERDIRPYLTTNRVYMVSSFLGTGEFKVSVSVEGIPLEKVFIFGRENKEIIKEFFERFSKINPYFNFIYTMVKEGKLREYLSKYLGENEVLDRVVDFLEDLLLDYKIGDINNDILKLLKFVLSGIRRVSGIEGMDSYSVESDPENIWKYFLKGKKAKVSYQRYLDLLEAVTRKYAVTINRGGNTLLVSKVGMEVSEIMGSNLDEVNLRRRVWSYLNNSREFLNSLSKGSLKFIRKIMNKANKYYKFDLNDWLLLNYPYLLVIARNNLLRDLI